MPVIWIIVVSLLGYINDRTKTNHDDKSITTEHPAVYIGDEAHCEASSKTTTVNLGYFPVESKEKGDIPDCGADIQLVHEHCCRKVIRYPADTGDEDERQLWNTCSECLMRIAQKSVNTV